jgi:hypothetical protein
MTTMDYGRLLSRAWDVIWAHKFLILLGLLVALTSSSSSSTISLGNNWDLRGTGDSFRVQPPDMRQFPWFNQLPREGRAWALGVPIFLVTVAIAVGLVIGIPLWVLSTLSRGGLIAGVSAIDGGGTSSFGEAFNAGWRKGWRLIGIGILPAIPGLLLALIGLGTAAFAAGVASAFRSNIVRAPLAGIGIAAAVLACILIPIVIVLSFLRTFAERACMLEDLGVFEAYGRGLSVLSANLGSAILLFLIQIAVSIVIGILLIVPTVIMVICCIFWPVLLLIQGTIAAYFSAMWTLAWREWTVVPAAGPAGS